MESEAAIGIVLIFHYHFSAVCKDYLSRCGRYHYPAGIFIVVDRPAVDRVSGVDYMGIPVFDGITPNKQTVPKHSITGKGVIRGAIEVDAVAVVVGECVAREGVVGTA